MRSLFLKIFLSFWLAQALIVALVVLATIIFRPQTESPFWEFVKGHTANQLMQAYEAGGAAGLKGAIYGIIIMLFIIFEPYGLYGRWLKMQHYFQLFPLYKKATFRRQKTYVKSDRNR